MSHLESYLIVMIRIVWVMMSHDDSAIEMMVGVM
jgi:hypothetical protein